MAFGVRWGESFEEKGWARSGVDGVWGQPMQLRGAWSEEGGSQWLWSLVAPFLVTSSSPLPSPVMSWPPEGADGREILMGWGGDSGSHPHFIQMAQVAPEAEMRPAAGVARE